MGSYLLLLTLAAAGPRVYLGGPENLAEPLVEELREEEISLIDAAPCADLACVQSRVSTFSADVGVLIRREASGERVIVVDSTGATVSSRTVGPGERLVDVVRVLLGLTPEPTRAPGGDEAPVDPVEEPSDPGASPGPIAPVRPAPEPRPTTSPVRPRPPPKEAPKAAPPKEDGCNPLLIVVGALGGTCVLVAGVCVAISSVDPSGCGSGCTPNLDCSPNLNCGSSCASLPLFERAPLPERPTPTARAAASMAF